jgi:hypothetical protein
MSSIDNPLNVRGVAELMVGDEEDIDFDSLEKNVMGILEKQEEKKPDISTNYLKEMDDIANNISSFESDLHTDNPPSKPNNFVSTEELNFSSLTKEDHLSNLPATTPSSYNRETSLMSYSDKQLTNMTHEEQKQEQIDGVFKEIETDENNFSFTKEEEEDDKAFKLEQIDMLRTSLSNDGVDLSRVPEVGPNSAPNEINAIHKILLLKNDRQRYADVFEEMILSGAYGLEALFDGNKVYFGRKPDLTGYSNTCKVKLRRMRYETSSFVSGIVKNHRMGSGWRILVELVPSLLLYSREKKLKQGDDIVSDQEYMKAMNKLNEL